MVTFYKLFGEQKVPEKIKLLIIADAKPCRGSYDNYFYSLNNGEKRSFFNEIMKQFRFLRDDITDETILLRNFLSEGYFLIDSLSHEAKDESSNEKEDENRRRNEFKDLIELIHHLKPEKIMIIGGKNRSLFTEMDFSIPTELKKKFITTKPHYWFAFPGNGWQTKFGDELPDDYILHENLNP
jgi:hypothetical protein